MNWMGLVNGAVGAIISGIISYGFKFMENKKLKKDKNSTAQKPYKSGQIAEGDFNQQFQFTGDNNTINAYNCGSKNEQTLQAKQSWKDRNWFVVLGFAISLIVGIIALYTSNGNNMFSSDSPIWVLMMYVSHTYIYLNIFFSAILCISFFVKGSYVYKKIGILITAIVCCIFTIGILLFPLFIEMLPNYDVNIIFYYGTWILLLLIFTGMFGLSFAKDVKVLIIGLAILVGVYTLCLIGANTIGRG